MPNTSNQESSTSGGGQFDFAAQFQMHYNQALEDYAKENFAGSVQEFETCLRLSNDAFKSNPPRFRYYESVHRFGMDTIEEFLADRFGFAFAREMGELMGKYKFLPFEYRKDQDKANEYAQKSVEIRNLYANTLKDQKDTYEDGGVVYVRPMFVRDKAIKLIHSAWEQRYPEAKRCFLLEALEIINQILSMDEEDFTVEYLGSEGARDFDLVLYRECYHDRFMIYQTLAELAGKDTQSRYSLLQKAYTDLLHYEKVKTDNKHPQALQKDFFEVTRPLAIIACESHDYNASLDYLIKFYEVYAELHPKFPKQYLLKEDIESCIGLLLEDPSCRDRWFEDLKTLIGKFQNEGKKESASLVYWELIASLGYYVFDLGEDGLVQRYLTCADDMARALVDKPLDSEVETRLQSLYYDSLELLQSKDLSEQETLCALNILFSHARCLVKKSEVRPAVEELGQILDLFKEKDLDSPQARQFGLDVAEFLVPLYLDQNRLDEARPLIDDLVLSYREDYQNNPSLSSALAYSKALLNQVILWDKGAVDRKMNIVRPATYPEDNLRAQQQLEQALKILQDLPENSAEKALLMRHIRRSLEILKDIGLGYIASRGVLGIVSDLNKSYLQAVRAESAGYKDTYFNSLRRLLQEIRDWKFMDIYFTADWYATMLYQLGQHLCQNGQHLCQNGQHLCQNGQHLCQNGQRSEEEKYFLEAYQIRKELEAEGIEQNTEFYADTLTLYADIMLQKSNEKEGPDEIYNILSKAHRIFESVESQLTTDSKIIYAICCFNLGRLKCKGTPETRAQGLLLIERAINKLEIFVSNNSREDLKQTLDSYKEHYKMLKEKCK